VPSKAPSTAQVNALITSYLKLYSDRYGNRPDGFNRFREKWGFQAMIEDLGYERAKEVVAYYFETRNIGHPVTELLYDYDRLDVLMRERAKDEEQRRILREKSKTRVEEWRKQNGS